MRTLHPGLRESIHALLRTAVPPTDWRFFGDVHPVADPPSTTRRRTALMLVGRSVLLSVRVDAVVASADSPTTALITTTVSPTLLAPGAFGEYYDATSWNGALETLGKVVSRVYREQRRDASAWDIARLRQEMAQFQP